MSVSASTQALFDIIFTSEQQEEMIDNLTHDNVNQADFIPIDTITYESVSVQVRITKEYIQYCMGLLGTAFKQGTPTYYIDLYGGGTVIARLNTEDVFETDSDLWESTAIGFETPEAAYDYWNS